MGTSNGNGDNFKDLMSVHEFATKFRVDVSVVRSWIKNGHIPYTLVGTRKMLRRSDAVKPVANLGIAVESNNRVLLMTYMVTKDSMDEDTAKSVVDGMDPSDIDAAVFEYKNK